MLKIYHARRARSARVIWLAEELGIPYELRTLEFNPETLRSEEYLKLHPLGQVPVIQDGDVTLIESGAIVQYLLEKHGQGRLEPPVGSKERPHYLQWFHFGEAAIARHIGEIVRNRFTKQKPQRNAALVAESRERYAAALAVLERALEGKPYVVGDAFTAADIMIAYGIVMGRITKELPADLPNVHAYLTRLMERPAYAKAWV
jgi:glutathione S-transferase